MATKRAHIADMIKSDMENRALAHTEPADSPAPPAVRRKPKPLEAVKIRLEQGDYERLQDIADRQGTKASILIRQAIKQIIKADAGNTV
jgi:hypothetical protein